MAQLKSTSITGNLAVTGNARAGCFIKNDGTNTEFLMANGNTLTLDNNVSQSINLDGSNLLTVQPFITALSIDNNTLKATRKSMVELGINIIYSFKGNKNPISVTSAAVGDVYHFNNKDYVCHKAYTSLTLAEGGENDWKKYWTNLGNYIDLSGFLPRQGGLIYGALDFKNSTHADSTLLIPLITFEGKYKSGEKQTLIQVIDSESTASADYYGGGHGIMISGGGSVFVGSGESSKTIYDRLDSTFRQGASEWTYITSDRGMYFYSNGNDIRDGDSPLVYRTEYNDGNWSMPGNLGVVGTTSTNNLTVTTTTQTKNLTINGKDNSNKGTFTVGQFVTATFNAISNFNEGINVEIDAPIHTNFINIPSNQILQIKSNYQIPGAISPTTLVTSCDSNGYWTFPRRIKLGQSNDNPDEKRDTPPTAGIHIHDLRDATMTPCSFGSRVVNFYFDSISDRWDGSSAANRWVSIMHCKGWTKEGNYSAWELAGNADCTFMDDSLRYRQGTMVSATSDVANWGDWQSVLTDKNLARYLKDTYLNGAIKTQANIYSGSVDSLQDKTDVEIGEVYKLGSTYYRCHKKITSATNSTVYWENIGNNPSTVAISFTPSAATNVNIPILRIADNTSWGSGQGATILLSGGSRTYIGSGESVDSLYLSQGLPADHGETLYISSDDNIHFYSKCAALADTDESTNYKEMIYTTSGNLKLNSSVISSLYQGREYATITQLGSAASRPSSGIKYNPFCSFKTFGGSWQIGHSLLPLASGSTSNIFDNAMQFHYVSDSTYNAKTDSNVINALTIFPNGSIGSNCTSGTYIKGRENALVRVMSSGDNEYRAVLSLKTGSGSWELGNYNTSTYTEELLFTYCTDENYNANNNTTTRPLRLTHEGNLRLLGPTLQFSNAKFIYSSAEKCIDVIIT